MKPVVLVVEDETSLMTMLRYNLEKEGYRVTEASDGEEAITAAVVRSRSGATLASCRVALAVAWPGSRRQRSVSTAASAFRYAS